MYKLLFNSILFLTVILFFKIQPCSAQNESLYRLPTLNIEGSLGAKGFGFGLGVSREKVTWMIVLAVAYEAKRWPEDEPEPEASWYWLRPVNEYDVEIGAVGFTCGIPIIKKERLEVVAGAGYKWAGHVKHYISTATGWDWYHRDEENGTWLLIGGRKWFNWNPNNPGYFSIQYDNIQQISAGLGYCF